MIEEGATGKCVHFLNPSFVVVYYKSKTRSKVSKYKWYTGGNCSPGQTLKKPKYLSEGEEGDVYMCDRVS